VRLQTPEAWQRYLGEWPDGVHAAAARRKLAAFIATDPPEAQGDYAVQLGAYSTEAAARADLVRHAGQYRQELAAVGLRVLKPRADGGEIWRLRTTALAEPAARDLCARLRTRGVDCVPLAD
jgi:hypothetical protein